MNRENLQLDHRDGASDGVTPVFAGNEGDDPVLVELERTRQAYLAVRGRHENHLNVATEQAEKHERKAGALQKDLAATHAALQTERDEKRKLQEQLASMQQQLAGINGRLEVQSRATDAAEDRAEYAEKIARLTEQQTQLLTDHLKRIYGAFFRGGVFGLILKACIELTGATKGMYLIRLPGEDYRFRVKDAYGFNKYPGAEPSPFIHELVKKVFEKEEAFLASDREALQGLPDADAEETFANCIVAPVVIHSQLSGVMIVADKENGTFSEEDCTTLLSIGSHASVALENLRLQTELRQTHVTTIAVLADAVELKDSYTSGHCQQVSRFARRVAADLDMSIEEQQRVYYAALLHDVGKIGVADTVLLKAGPLLPEEMALARAHVRLGYDLICQIPWLTDVAGLVLYHHERWDGGGYPDGLSKTDIPLGSRIVGAVDAYCTMITRRPYQTGRSKEDAIVEMRRSSGGQFDPEVVEALLRVIDLPEVALDGEEAEFMNRYGVDEDKFATR